MAEGPTWPSIHPLFLFLVTGVFVTAIQQCVKAFGHCHLKVNRKIHHLNFPVGFIACTR